MSESESSSPQEILKDILRALQSAEPEARLNGVAQLHTTNYSSEAIRGELEKLALRDPNKDVRAEALTALDLATQRHVREHINKIKLGERRVLLQEIKDWEKLGLLEKERAEVIRRRYDFDIALPTSPKVDSVKPIASPPEKIPAPVAPPQLKPQPKPAAVAPAQTFKPAPVAPPKSAATRPTLTQILLSENSIKIALYLGAFFVIASAAILAALYEVARLPILIIATLIFGGFAVAIRKRLPQPSFAIFVVFSFLLPITANVLKESLSLSLPFKAAYWVFISTFMALIWMGGARLYESRLFSVTALASFTVALYRVGDMFYAASEFYATMLGLAALTGLLGVWALKQWKDANFARPLFFAAQLLQVAALIASISVFFIQFIGSASTPLWNLASVFTWGFAFLFYAISDLLFPSIFFPWLAAGTLFVMPWFIGAAFKMDALGGTISFLVWGLILSSASELTYRLEKIRKYSLPVLLVSVGIFAVTATYGFTDQVTTGFISALVIAVAYAALHFIRPRGWLWAISLFNFIVAYFAFFSLPFMEKIHVFFGYELLGISLIFLLPDLLLKNDLKDNWAWRLPPRIYGAFFTILSFIIYPITQEVPLINIAVMFGVYTLFFAVYAMRYDKALIGYLAAISLVISVIYVINYFNLNIVLESLSLLSALYFFGGFALKKNESRASWRAMLEASGLTLGGIVALTAAVAQKEYIGWFVAVIGALFIIQMYSRKQHLFEIGAQLVFLIASALILNDFHVAVSYMVMGLSLVILSLDMLFTLTFKAPRPFGIVVKSAGAFFVFAASMIFLTDNNDLRATVGFGIYTIFFCIYTAAQRKAAYGYLPSAYLPLTIIFMLSYFKQDAWLPTLTVLAVIYFILGIAIRSEEAWSFMLRNSALALGTFVSLGALFALKETSGWYIAVIGLLFSAEMYIRKNGYFEIGAQMLFPAALYLILRDFKLDDYVYILLGFSLIWLGLDLIFSRTFKAPRPLQRIVQLAGGLTTLIASIALASENNSAQAAIGFAIYTVFFAIYTAVQRKAIYGYLPAAYLPLTIFFALNHFNVDAWLPALTGLAVIYFIIGAIILSQASWSRMLRNSALTLGTFVSLGALFALKETGGWYALAVGLLFAAEIYLSRNGWFEIGAPVMFNIGAYLILRDFKIDELAYRLLAYSLVWLITDLLAQLTFTNPRPLKWIVRGIGATLTLVNYLILFSNVDSKIAAIGFGVYALLFLITSLIYRQPNLIYAFTLTLPLCATFLFRALGLTKWIHPVIVVAAMYYIIGYTFRASKRAKGWDAALLFSGLGIGVLVSFAAPALGGVDAALPVALAATLWAAEAFARRNVWLGFPANGLYLLAYFIILIELNVNQPQYFSIGAAMLGMIQHYLLTRIESKKGAFLMGMVSQLILLGTTYIQMVNTQQLGYFFVLFFESLVVITYGVIIRSRSLTFVPIGIVALGLIAVLYSALKDISAVILVGCSGVILLMLGILAVMMREKITEISEKLSDWEA